MDITEEERQQIKEKVEKLRASRFKQQMLPAWRPVPSFGSTMIIFAIFGLVFLCLGIVLYVMSDKIQEVQFAKYNEYCGTNATSCEFPLKIAEDVKAPIYVYYQLDNFYQNHRRYVKSKDAKQLMGNLRTVAEVNDTCTPVVTNADLDPATKFWGTNIPVNTKPTQVAWPCGLIAKSVFTDTFTLRDNKKNIIAIDSDNIAWKSDVEFKYKNGNTTTEQQWLDVTNQHFIVWMRTAGLPNFRKLFGRIDVDLPMGTYMVQVAVNQFGTKLYDVSSFNGNKGFVMSTTNVMGGKNYFLAICYIVVGALCLMFAVIFFAAFMQRKAANPAAAAPARA